MEIIERAHVDIPLNENVANVLVESVLGIRSRKINVLPVLIVFILFERGVHRMNELRETCKMMSENKLTVAFDFDEKELESAVEALISGGFIYYRTHYDAASANSENPKRWQVLSEGYALTRTMRTRLIDTLSARVLREQAEKQSQDRFFSCSFMVDGEVLSAVEFRDFYWNAMRALVAARSALPDEVIFSHQGKNWEKTKLEEILKLIDASKIYKTIWD